MKKFIRFSERISLGSGILAGILMLFGFSLVIIEVLLRTFLNKTLYITEEYSGYLMVAITFLGLAYTLQEKGHIRMVFLHKLLKGKSRKIIDIYSFVIGAVFFFVVTYSTTMFFWDSVISQSRSMQISETYLAIPQFFMPLGSFILTLQFIAEVFKAIINLRSGDFEEQESDIETEALGR